jgi:hypothetical protein
MVLGLPHHTIQFAALCDSKDLDNENYTCGEPNNEPFGDVFYVPFLVKLGIPFGNQMWQWKIHHL